MNDTHATSWEEWGQVDPLWAIFTEPTKQSNRWDVDEFFTSGRQNIDALWTNMARFGLPGQHTNGLDFGCGVGRLTRALGGHLDHVLGLDIAPSMIALAREYNAEFDHLTFAVHQGTDLAEYPSNSFDAVCCLLVLQHLPSVAGIRRYVQEFVRVLAPGGVLMLQLPDYVPPKPPLVGLRQHLRPRTRMANALHALGVSPKYLYDHMNWRPEMTMRALPETEVAAIVEAGGGRMAWTSSPLIDPTGVRNLTYLITR